MESMVLAIAFAAALVYMTTILCCVLSGQGSRVPPHTDLRDTLEEITFPLLIVLSIGAVVSWIRDVDETIILASVLAGILGLVLVHISFRVYGFARRVREDRRERSNREVFPEQGISLDQARRDNENPYNSTRLN